MNFGPVAAMVARLAHRGPDGEWTTGDGSAHFGMARLAIRGLDSGVQPIVEPDSGVMVVCNGEIDNHQELRAFLEERGHRIEQDTDVAVLPGLYLELGEAFVERLAGAYALAVWDPRERKILLARDRSGERPLFFRHEQGVVRFASQIAALTASVPDNLEWDGAALRRYLQLGHFPAPDSPYIGIHKVGPAETIVIDATGLRRERYWRWPRAVPMQTDTSLDAFDAVFRAAVFRQTEVDVPFGLFLSGGVDSSLISAVAKSLRPDKPLTAYGLRFSEDSYDEGQFAEQVARQLGIEYVPVWVKPEDVPGLLAELIGAAGEPLADPAWVPTALLSRRAARDIRISLSGEGADELFAGYPTYFGAGIAEGYSRLPGGLRRVIRQAVDRWPPSDKKVTLSFLLKRFVQGDELDGLARHVLWTSSVPPALLKRLGLEPEPWAWAAPTGENTLLDRLQHYDLERPLAEGLLTKADRASMLSALELRAPFLDPEVMDFAAALPPKERVKGIETKVFLKRYAERYLPKDIVYRKKRGLSVPIGAWLRGPLREWAETTLAHPGFERLGVDTRALRAVFDEHQRRAADHARALWALLVLGEWLAWAERRGD
ncbi:asparagine synthetase B [Methylomagnum ishizawai]|nr:asparagine synthetase B [Methylomagnum ishizawai]